MLTVVKYPAWSSCLCAPWNVNRSVINVWPGTHLFPDSLLRPESGLLSNKCIVWGDTWADKAKEFIGKGHQGREQQDKKTQEDCSATWLAVSGFMVIKLVSELSPANHSDSGCFLAVHHSLNQGKFQQGEFWEAGRTHGLSFWHFPILLVGSSLLFPHSLPGLPVKDNSCKGSLSCLSWEGSFP